MVGSYKSWGLFRLARSSGPMPTVADIGSQSRRTLGNPNSFQSLAIWATTSMLLLSGLILSGCSGMQGTGNSVYREGLVTADGQPGYITVQHCLIGFQGSVQGKVILRSEAEAEALAQELFAKAQAGEEFSKIVVAHTDDSAPGIYRLANDGFPGDTTSRIPSKHVMPRSQMVPAFGDVGFNLEVGEVGLAAYDRVTSPFGWHIIKRIK